MTDRKTKDHAIGERFEVDHIIYEVRPARSCQGCSIYIEEENECLDSQQRFGHCAGASRPDGQDVKFIQVGEEQNEQVRIAEINQHIRDGINQWADIMLLADADEWAVKLNYYPRDLMNAVLIYQHIASNIGIKAGRIDEQKAVEFGQRLRQLVIDMTGYDPHEFWKGNTN